ncbi:hypothetical protein CQW23_28457 [Capsicum baccatum]|uniref:Ubiquitin-like protease family profile domain-containing protein n=1 Tax=Capsicum baccatum TaxID=33114 RepID=A0A2G2VGK1_CAPBA|nr:hypothetical protein CQW23_28457 [Capsicum baccatum]
MFYMQMSRLQGETDGLINAINALTSSVKEMTSKRDIIPTKRISYPYTSQEIKAAKRRRKDTSKALSSIKKPKFQCLYLCLVPLFSVQGPPKSSMSQKRGFSIPTGLSWHLVDEVYIPINYGDEFQWMLAIVILKESCIRVYDSMLQRKRSGPLSEIQKLDKILSTYLDMSGFLDQKVRTD